MNQLIERCTCGTTVINGETFYRHCRLHSGGAVQQQPVQAVQSGSPLYWMAAGAVALAVGIILVGGYLLMSPDEQNKLWTPDDLLN